MQNKIVKKIALGGVFVGCLSSSLHATLQNEKITLYNNMVVQYNQKPLDVDNLSSLFTQGTFYGRLRANTFYWDWLHEDYATGGKLKDNKAMGLGGSVVYKTARYYGWSATAGIYTSQNPSFFRMSSDDVGYLKAGKDTLSRYKVSQGLGFGISVLAQAFVQYNHKNTSVVVGRQLIEGVFTKSNDTKMIPNTFDAVTLYTQPLRDTKVMMGYVAKQKLRDHTNAHDVIAYDPANPWSQNDDSVVNRSLTVALVGTNNKLLLASVTNKSIEHLKFVASYANVVNIFASYALEGYYSIDVGDGWKVIPGMRYMQQIDTLHASVNVASLKGQSDANVVGYSDPKSLDASMVAMRLDFKKGNFLGRFGYSSIADKADIVSPWRAAPTGGFTRAMGQYNWFANTKTYMVQVGYDFKDMTPLAGWSILGRYAIQDFDDHKDATAADSDIIHVDLLKNITQSMQMKVRLACLRADDTTRKSDGSYKTDYSYNEYRLEFNYFF